MRKAPGQLFQLLVTVGWLASVGLTVLSAAEPLLSQVPVVVPVAADGVQRATVTLDSYSYTPKHLIVEAGKPVELTLTSVTWITPHNFIIKDPAGSLFVEQDVSADKTVTIKFTPTQPGTFPIYCDKRLWPLPSHRDKGMEGKLEVR
ncbi:MAG: cupredoxin domain-containing protein [Nitrospirota bacterium]|nr:cupredoxin domain-containing protein [Nitrospirota bacterium]MDP2383016.1 cupredoxin domain-containing protein [Nitrospirota bacterium]MDP3596798.1 cupredoxin domain-containing protein [Nitrospirota bacterium]